MPQSNPHPTRRLKFEPLEDRRLLAVFTVSNLSDGPVTAAGDLPGSLRQAIFDANALPGDDEIEFALEIDGPGIIPLSAGELEITEGLTLNGPGQEWLTIDAQRSSRVFNITAMQGDFYIGRVTLKNGLTTSENTVDPLGFLTTANGGAIRFIGEGQLTVYDATLTENEVSESDTLGGAIYSGSGKLVVMRTAVKQNVAGRVAGGIYAGTAVGEPGENIVRRGELEVLQSTISGNRSLSGDGSGGGIFSQGNFMLVDSTVSGNMTQGIFGGGCVGSASSVEVTRSTIANNHAPSASPSFFGGGLGTQSSTLIESSVIAGNTSRGQAHDLNAQNPSISYSLIGDTTGSGITATTGTGNLLNIDPLLGPLADNGGPTQTHALLPGSPAIDAGNVGIVDPPMYDQRGAPFNRIVDGNVPADVVIDIGAYEAQGVPSADFNTDNAIDGFDFLTWQRGFGMANAGQADGDSDFDADVDASDLAAWRLTYGQGISSSVAATTAESSPPDPAIAIAAALADEAFEDERLLALPQTSTVAPPDVLDPIRSSAHPSSAAADSVAKEEKAIRTSATRDGGETDSFAGPWDGLRRKFLK